MTSDERHHQIALLVLLVDTDEDYQQANECELELLHVLVLDPQHAYQGREI